MSTFLAFDTSTEQLSIAIGRGATTWRHERAGGAKASAELIPAILALLAEAGVGLADLDAIAFGQGPGAFTGLRTACAVAQGLAYGAGKPVLPIGSLLAVAEAVRGGAAALRVWTLMDARMNQIYGAEYEYGGEPGHVSRSAGSGGGNGGTGGSGGSGGTGGWRELRPPAVWSASGLNAAFRERAPEVVAGSALDAFGAALETGVATRVASALPQAWAMLPLADALWREGGAVEPALALPLYVRDKVADTIAERALTRAARDRATHGEPTA